MNHPNREEWVPYLFGEAKANARRTLDEHLRECPACRTEIDAWQRSLGRLAAWKLPKVHRQPEIWQPVLKWAVAASIVLGIGFGLGRLSSPTPALGDDWRSQVEASVKAALVTDLQNALERAQGQTEDALARLEDRLANTAQVEAEEMARILTDVLNRAHEEDRRAMLALYRDLEKQNAATYVALRKDLETVASLTDEELRQTRLRLIQFADNLRPDEREINP